MKEKTPAVTPPVQQFREAENATTKTPPAFQLKAGEKENPAQMKPELGQQQVAQQKPKDNEKAQELPYTQHAIPNGAVTIPKNATGSMPVVVIYGGMVDRGGSYTEMMKWTPSNYYSSHILVFADHFAPYKGVKKSAEAIFKKQGVQPNYRAILGFSAGGMTVANAKNAESWGVIGMIDPAVNSNFDSFGASVYMVWDFWDSKFTGANKTLYNAAKKKHNAKLQKDWKAQEQARKDEMTKTGIETSPIKKPDEVTDPETVDPKNVDPRFKFHQRIKGGEISGASEHLTVGHLNMPSAWFSKYGANL